MLESSRDHAATASLEARVLGGVRAAILRVDRRVRPEAIRAEASLVDDLGLDSIKFVGLGIALEEALGIEEFPMQDWSDREAAREFGRFTVASLVAVCMECLGEAPGA
jgi:acyl carrier protein